MKPTCIWIRGLLKQTINASRNSKGTRNWPTEQRQFISDTISVLSLKTKKIIIITITIITIRMMITMTMMILMMVAAVIKIRAWDNQYFTDKILSYRCLQARQNHLNEPICFVPPFAAHNVLVPINKQSHSSGFKVIWARKTKIQFQ